MKILTGDARETLKELPERFVQCVVTSPPYYGLRDYGVTGQIGMEETPEMYVEQMVRVFREVWRVLKDDGTLWLNLGDSYNGSGKGGNPEGSPFTKQKTNQGSLLDRSTRINGLKPKDLIGIPWMVAFALRADGWYLRQDIIWAKPNPMPESVRDRPTRSHEYIFLLTKNKRYYYDFEAILEPANYDGRRQTKVAPGKKLQEGGNTISRKGGERWANKIKGRTERKMEGTNYGGDGKGLHGHSGYYDSDGKLRTHIMPPIGGKKKADGQNATYSGNTPEQVYKDGIPARNKRDVWWVPTKPYKEAHFATFPPDLIEPCILAGSREGDIVLDPFNGSGTTVEVCIRHNRDYIGCEINPNYVELTKKRLAKVQLRMSLDRERDAGVK